MQEVCYFFVQGNCRNGNNCRFLHSHPSSSFSNQQPEQFSNNNRSSPYINTPCWYMVENGWCPYRRNCKFIHELSDDKQYQGGAKQVADTVCVYYLRGNCTRGKKCWFRHDQSSNDTGNESQQTAVTDTVRPVEVDQSARTKSSLHNGSIPMIATPPPDFSPRIARPTKTRSDIVQSAAPIKTRTLSNLTREEMNKLRQDEIAIVRKRVTDLTVDGDSFLFEFVPSDPEWPYDVSTLPLSVQFPMLYPKEAMLVTVLDSELLPSLVMKSSQKGIDNWLERQMQVCLVQDCPCLQFRPFLKWLDKNLQDLYTEGLTWYKQQLLAAQSGIDVFSPEALREKLQSTTLKDDTDEDDESGVDDDDDDIGSSELHDHGEMSFGTDSVRRGTELCIRDVSLKENIAAIQFKTLSLVLRCLKCRKMLTLPQVEGGGRLHSYQCDQCFNKILVGYRDCLMHSFSSVAGYLDVEGCLVEDVLLPASMFISQCLNCNAAQKHDGASAVASFKEFWCHTCHTKSRFLLSGIRLTVLTVQTGLNDTGRAKAVTKPKKERRQREPEICPGFPLPQNGACKHYKKSFRWLRFPCCHRAFPCDVCHDDATADDPHDLLWANRMVCGFCCNEQSVSDLCKSCGKGMTRARSVYWEGGKGCRDKSKMSRHEKKKYAGVNKTVSKKSTIK